MVSGPSAIGPPPVIRFRPDPGEPAARVAAPETQTAALVTAQEQRNETRLRNQALARGEDILFSNRTFNLALGNISPVYSGGLTTVVTRPDANGFAPDNAIAVPGQGERTTEAEESQGGSPVEDEARAVPENPEDATEPTEEELEREDQTLSNEESRIERNLTRAQLEQDRALEQADGVQFAQAQREETQLEREQEEVAQEQRDIELERLQRQLNNILETADDAIQGSLNAASGVLDVLFGLGREETPAPAPAAAGAAAPDLSQAPGGPGFFASSPRIR